MTDRTISRMFTEGDESSELLISWWEGLNQDRGERASLRRAAAPAEVVFGPSFHKLLGGLRRRGYPLGADRAAALLADIKNCVILDRPPGSAAGGVAGWFAI